MWRRFYQLNWAGLVCLAGCLGLHAVDLCWSPPLEPSCFIEIRQRQRGLGKDITKYAKECIKCDDDNEGGPGIPRWITEMANRPVPQPIFVTPRDWTDYIPGTPEQLENAGEASLIVGVTIIVVVAPEIVPVIRIPRPIRIPIPQPAF